MLRTFKKLIWMQLLLPTAVFALDFTLGNTTVGSQSDAQRLAHFSNYLGQPVASIPANGEDFLDYTGGVFNPTFPDALYYVWGGLSYSLSPNRSIFPRTTVHAPIVSGMATQFSWSGRHGQPIKDNFLASALNAFFNMEESASWWQVSALSEYQQAQYFEAFSVFPSEHAVFKSLVDNGPMLATIVPFNIKVMVVGFSQDQYGNWLLEFNPFFGSDWGEQGFGKMLFDDFADFKKISKSKIVSDFSSPLVEPRCQDLDQDQMCSWGLGDRPLNCPVECDLALAQDCEDSVAGELSSASCFRFDDGLLANDLEIIDFNYSDPSGYLLFSFRNNGPGSFRNSPQISVNVSNGSSASHYFSGQTVGQTFNASFPKAVFGWQEGASYTVTVSIDPEGIYEEGDELNNVLTKTITVPVAPKPDLVVQSITRNQDMIEVVVANQGNAPCSSGLTYTLDLYYGPWPSYVSQYTTCPDPGTSKMHSFSISQFGINAEKDIIFSAYVDNYNNIVESNDNNNVLISTIHFNSAVGIDMVVNSVDYQLATDSVIVTVQNQGALRATTSSAVRLTVGSTSSIAYAPALMMPGQMASLSFALSTFGSPAGIQNIQAQADYYNSITGELSETNNSWIGTLDLPSPDLVIDSILAVGDNIQVKVSNIGGKKNTRTAQINVVGNNITKSFSVTTLDVAGSYTQSFTKADFSIATTANYTFTAQADVLANVSESNETNNSASAVLALTAPAVIADLVVEDIYVSGSYIYARIKNLGTGTAAAPVTDLANGVAKGYYYHTDVGSLLTSTSSYYRTNLGLNDGGTYTVTACTRTSTVESNTQNNCLTKTLVMPTPAKPDLVVTNIVESGSYLVVTVKNQGNANASYFYTSLALGSTSVTAYSSGLSYGLSTNLSIAKSSFSLGAGTYSFTATADNYGYVSESNESNNSFTKSLTFASASSVDLIIESITASGTNISVKVKNQGASAASYSYTRLTVNGITRTSYIGSLNAASSYTHTFYASDFGVSSGTYTMTAGADYYNYVTETNESNNVTSSSVTLGSSGGATGANELSISYLYSDRDYIYVEIYNSGFQTVTTDFYINAKETGTTGGYSLFNVTDIAPYSYQTKLIPRTYVIPSTRTSGSVTVTIDSDFRIPELNESNNTSTQTLYF